MIYKEKQSKKKKTDNNNNNNNIKTWSHNGKAVEDECARSLFEAKMSMQQICRIKERLCANEALKDIWKFLRDLPKGIELITAC